ncbi:hypothetical protein VTN77DRAFT_1441 [Rasamsonia byssochlamydoides]|uniref:uncharacterized protein n=1 Tax=Rasamsonia byssochlamydoides TaxID=89139 RepID=UPI00374239D6
MFRCGRLGSARKPSHKPDSACVETCGEGNEERRHKCRFGRSCRFSSSALMDSVVSIRCQIPRAWSRFRDPYRHLKATFFSSPFASLHSWNSITSTGRWRMWAICRCLSLARGMLVQSSRFASCQESLSGKPSATLIAVQVEYFA